MGHSLQSLQYECFGVFHSLQQICQMQNHFIFPNSPSLSRGPRQQANHSAASFPLKKSEAVFIDLTSGDQTAETQDYQIDRNGGNHSSRVSTTLPSLQKSKAIEKRKNFKNKNPSIRKGKQCFGEGLKQIDPAAFQEEMKEFQTMMDDCNQPFSVELISRPPKIIKQAGFIDHSNKLATKEAEQGGKGQEKESLRAVITQIRGKEPERLCEKLCFEGGMSMMMRFWLTSHVDEPDARVEKRLTRTQVKNDQSGELNLLMDLDDREVRIRYNVAKYRFSIPECAEVIAELASKVTSKLHYGTKRATVLPAPNTERGSFNHKILVGCLKIQLGKRRFIDLVD